MIESLNLLYFISALSQKITNTIYLRFCGCDKISSIVHFTLREFLCSGDLFGQVWNKKGDRSSQYFHSAKQQGTDSSPAFSSPNIQSSRRKTKDFEIESLYSFLLLDKVFFPLLIRFGRIGPPCLMVLSFADSLSYYSSFQKKKKNRIIPRNSYQHCLPIFPWNSYQHCLFIVWSWMVGNKEMTGC